MTGAGGGSWRQLTVWLTRANLVCHENQMVLTPAMPKQPSNVGGMYEKRYFFLDSHPSILLAHASE